MKNKIILYTLLACAPFALSSCSDDDEEVCAQEEICTDNSVTACCDESVCTYMFGGKEYSEAELNTLADDIGCSASAVPEDGKSEVMESLQALGARIKSSF